MRPTDRPSSRNPIIEAARRTQIIEAAIEVIAETGYAQASLSRIAARAAVSKSVVSYHFNGKDELFDALLAEIYDGIWAFIEPRIQVEQTAAGKLRVYITALLAYARDHRLRLVAVNRVAFNHRGRGGDVPAAPGTDDPIVAMLSRMLTQGQHDGEFAQFDPDVMAIAINQALDGALAQFARNPAEDLDHYASELVSLFDKATRA